MKHVERATQEDFEQKIDPMWKDVFERDLVARFNFSGNKAIIVSVVTRKMNKKYQISRLKIPFYTQVLQIVDFDKWSQNPKVLKPILMEERMLVDQYPERRVRWVDYLNKREDNICLVFDDEVLSLKILGSRFGPLFRVKLASSSPDSVFCGFYEKSFIFTNKHKNRELGRQLPFDVEFVSQDQIDEILDEADQNGLFDSLERLGDAGLDDSGYSLLD